MKEKIIKYFNQGAATYDAYCNMQSHAATQLATYLQNSQTKKILEIGCGTGLLSQQLHHLFPDASLLLTDISPAMIQHCHSKFSVHRSIQLTCMDGENCNISESFDLIASSMTFHWFENLTQSIEKLMAKLKTGGSLVFSILGENSLHEWRQLCSEFNIKKNQLFPCAQKLKNHFPNMKIDIEKKSYLYHHAHDFLQSLKNLGARASNSSEEMTSTKKLRQLLRKNKQKITITYEIIYGRYQKC